MSGIAAEEYCGTVTKTLERARIILRAQEEA